MAELCQIGDERQLLCEDVTVTVGAGLTVSGNQTLTTNRGNVQGFAVICNNNTDAFLSTLNFLINSTNVLKNQNLGSYVSENNNEKIFPVRWENGSVVNWTLINSGAAALVVNLKFYYVLPIMY